MSPVTTNICLRIVLLVFDSRSSAVLFVFFWDSAVLSGGMLRVGSGNPVVASPDRSPCGKQSPISVSFVSFSCFVTCEQKSLHVWDLSVRVSGTDE